MKFCTFFALCFLSFGSLSAAQYAGIELGTDHLELTNRSHTGMKVGYKAAVKFGYIFGNGIRTEAEVAYRKNHVRTKYNMGDADTVVSKEYSNYHSWSYMVNMLYDINQLATRDIIPYLGVGVGYCQNTDHNKIKSNTADRQDKLKDDRFAYQGIVGLKYAINADYATALEYQYFCGQSHAKAHSVGLSLIRTF